jgi:hypothetical protein
MLATAYSNKERDYDENCQSIVQVSYLYRRSLPRLCRRHRIYFHLYEGDCTDKIE